MLFIYLALIILMIPITKQDLPIHCLKSEIVGTWRIEASDLFPVSNGLEMKCGHDLPTLEKTSWIAKSPKELKNNFTLTLNDDDIAEIELDNHSEKGNWTMIYNQGFNLEFSDLSFFAFSKYEIKEDANKKKKFNSKCYSTCVGWYRNSDKTKWGCYQAFKLNENPEEITFFNSNFYEDGSAVIAVEPEEKNTPYDNITINNIFQVQSTNNTNNEKHDTIKQSFNNEKIPENFPSKNFNNKNNLETKINLSDEHKNTFYNSKADSESNDLDHKIFFSGTEDDLAKSFNQGYLNTQNPIGGFKKGIKRKIKIRKAINSKHTNDLFTNFVQLKNKKLFKNLNLQTNFHNLEIYLEQLNKVPKSWEASVYPNFSQMTVKELNKFAGRTKSAYKQRNKKDKKNKDFIKDDLSNFPKNFDWKKLIRPAGSQGYCGSCYAYATIRMLEARLKFKYNHEVQLSVQHPVDCSIYNQGCEGGFPFLVLKFADEFELLPEHCKPYTGKISKCMQNNCDTNKLPYKYKTKNYHYVGGSYGKCSEKLMMEELLMNGPLVISFQVDFNFMFYKKGIYHSVKKNSWKNKNLPKPEWVIVDHSVLLVGWGEDKETKEKFWIAQNTWGPKWGEKGLFRIRRGVDELGIESVCEAGDPYILERKTGKKIKPKKNLKGLFYSYQNAIGTKENA